MPISHDNESPVTCSTCGKPAVRRTVRVFHHGLGGRMVSYDTHSGCLTEDAHHAALKRLDSFYKKLHGLQYALNHLGEEQRKLDGGGVMLLADFVAPTPSACEVREMVQPIADVRAFGQVAEVKAEPRPLKGQSVTRILRDLKKAAAPVIEQMKAKHAAGDF